MKFRKPSPAMAVALVALFVALGGSAVAASGLLIHTKNIANGAVTNRKLANGAVGLSKLNKPVRRALAIAGTPRGSVQGPQGPKGDKGDPGGPGPQGPPGPAGAGTNTQVTSVGTDSSATSGFFSIAGNDGGSQGSGVVHMTADSVQLNGTKPDGTSAESSQYAGIGTRMFNGLTAADLSDLSYTTGYVQDNPPGDQNAATPYLKVKFLGSDGTSCGGGDATTGNEIIFSPNTQSPNLDYSGLTETFHVISPTSTVRENDDAGTGPDNGIPWDQVVGGDPGYATSSGNSSYNTGIGADKICEVEIIEGDAVSQGARGWVTSLTLGGLGQYRHTWSFGSSS